MTVIKSSVLQHLWRTRKLSPWDHQLGTDQQLRTSSLQVVEKRQNNSPNTDQLHAWRRESRFSGPSSKEETREGEICHQEASCLRFGGGVGSWLAVLVISGPHPVAFPFSTRKLCYQQVFRRLPRSQNWIMRSVTCQSTSVVYCSVPVPLIMPAWRCRCSSSLGSLRLAAVLCGSLAFCSHCRDVLTRLVAVRLRGFALSALPLLPGVWFRRGCE